MDGNTYDTTTGNDKRVIVTPIIISQYSIAAYILPKISWNRLGFADSSLVQSGGTKGVILCDHSLHWFQYGH